MKETTQEILQKDAKDYLPVYGGRYGIALDHGKGVKVYDNDGKEYVDFLGGIAVNVLGHGYPALVEAVSRQAAQMIHCSNLFYTRVQADAAAKLVALSGLGKAFFANSGAEANEGAIKAARKYAHMIDPDKSQIITAWNSFHGRTLATLTATGQPHYQEGCGPLPAGFDYVHYNDIEELESMMSDKTCAVMLETVQGEGGVYPPKGDYLKQVRALCDKYGALLILDEVQAGMGRCGTFFAYDTYGVKPDIVTLAKGLAGGVPIGAFLCTDEVAKAFHPGDHGTTFGGNPLACAAANVVIDTISQPDFLAHVKEIAAYFRGKLEALAAKYPELVKEVRGQGLLLGMELTKPGTPAVDDCRANGVIINCTMGNVLRFVPPLIITESDVDTVVAALDAALGRM
jgi:aminotransferase, acetylornithine/succinylornithine family